jgi:hypothetical protein
MRIEHLLWQVDTIFDKREAEHKIIEKTAIEEMAAHKAKSAIIGEFKAMTSKSFYKDPVEKIGIL